MELLAARAFEEGRDGWMDGEFLKRGGGGKIRREGGPERERCGRCRENGMGKVDSRRK